ncbi:MAG: class II fructose-1,6-bisphosphate aldolase [Patescibacteria group bacterium]|nr:class II fructose-1,6-bisphosphate aldolase [Patescibacteria group bacterium]
MLVSLKKILIKAQRGKYAVPAFNINDLEILQAIMVAAKRLKSPVIIQASEGAIKYAGMKNLVNMVKVASKGKIPVVFHLDHGKDLRVVKQAIKSGFTSVMYDGSKFSFKKNLRLTKKVVGWARKKGVSVEAELGALKGVEDLVSVSEKEAILTNPKQVGEFVAKTGCDALAIAIGTSHGAYKFKGMAKLDMKRLQEIKKNVKIPLVLHGASGVPQELVNLIKKCGGDVGNAKGNSPTEIRKAIKQGICKINIDTDLRLAFTAGVRCKLQKDKKVIDPRKILGEAKELIEKVAEDKIKLCGSQNKI